MLNSHSQNAEVQSFSGTEKDLSFRLEIFNTMMQNWKKMLKYILMQNVCAFLFRQFISQIFNRAKPAAGNAKNSADPSN